MDNTKSTYAIIGAGNLGHAMAADLALKGYRVRIQNRTESVIDKINENNGITATGLVEGHAILELATPSIAEAVDGADIIMVTIPGTGYRDVARKLAPCITEKSLIFLHPGQTLGSLEMLDELRKQGVTGLPTFVEAHTSILTCRVTGPATVNISGIKDNVLLGVFPANRKPAAEIFKEPYPTLKVTDSILYPGLDNLNPIVHTVVTLGNLSRIDNGEDFLYYWDGYTPAISSIIEQMDLERLAIANLLKVDAITLFGFFRSHYGHEAKDLTEIFRTNPAYEDITGPKSIRTRLFLEDIPTGLIAYSSLGKHFGIPTPLIDATITLIATIYHEDFWSTGRTMENLGVNDLNLEEFLHFIQTGERP